MKRKRQAPVAPVLHLVPIYCAGQSGFLTPLEARITSAFGLRIERHAPWFDPEVAFDSNRGQYDSRVLLSHLRESPGGPPARVLGVAGVDLFIPVLTYVFGEAELDGRSAVISAFRLDNELYGMPSDPALLFERLVKEALHELGHTFSLLHCHRSDCVMSSSTYVEGIDLKSDRFCNPCLRRLRKRLAELGAA